MEIMIVDDERILLETMTRVVGNVFPRAKLVPFRSGKEALAYIHESVEQKKQPEYAFLDIELNGMTGIELALDIKKVIPAIKIIFCTAYSTYAYDAWNTFPKGYLLKPVTEQAVIRTLDEMVSGWRAEQEKNDGKLKIQTFGNFEVFMDEKPIHFEREKAKELLAYLVDRRGASVTNVQIASVLWEERPFDVSMKNQVTVMKSSLKKTLKDAGIQDVIVSSWNHFALDMKKVRCDSYDFLMGDAQAVNSFRGEYMTNYSWAEFTNGMITLQSDFGRGVTG